MSVTSTLSRPEFAVVHRLRSVAEQRPVLPRQRFSAQLRAALVDELARDTGFERRAAGDCVTC